MNEPRYVRAKRLGWDEPETMTTRTDILDPYDYGDAVVEGELVMIKVEGKYVEAYTNYLVGGQVVDPTTIEDLPGQPRS